MKNTHLKKESKHLTTYNSTIFSIIYEINAWGGKKGEYYSGTGSHNENVVEYAEVVSDFILKNKICNIIEIGCGDFNVSNIVLKKLEGTGHEYFYTGYDVVKPLIKRNKSFYGTPEIKFVYKDSCTGIIKSGDLLIVRQVLQHLNNKSIKQIVDKFKNYKYIIVSEHQASDKYDKLITPNKDKKTDQGTRIGLNSGVYLDKEPFKCKIAALMHSIPEPSYNLDAAINTYLILND